MRTRTAQRRLSIWLVVTVACGACTAVPGSMPPPSESPVATPAASAPDPALVDEWIRFRQAFGLRADRDWVLGVAAQPASRNDTQIPLLPWELRDLGKTVEAQGALLTVLRTYGESHRSVYAGTVIRDDGTVELLMVGPIDGHVAALHAVLRDRVGWAVRSVRWSLAELDALAEDVLSEALPWADEGIRVVDAGPTLPENQVLVDFYAASEAAAGAEIRARLGDPSWLALRWDGPLPWTGPRGGLVVHVVDRHGRPVEGLVCEAVPRDPTVGFDTGESFMTDDEGVCRQTSVPAVAYRVVVNRLVAGELVPVGEGSVIVRADGLTSTVVVLSE